MAKVEVKMFATVREAAGTASIRVDATDVAEVLRRLGEVFGPPMKKMLDGLRSDPDKIVILINGRNAGYHKALSRRLADGDEVALFPPVSGG